MKHLRADTKLYTRMLTFGLILVLIVAAPGWGLAADSPATYWDDVETLSQEIDQQIEAKWDADGIVPAPMSDDAEYFRRISLDIAGRIPPASEVRWFLADQSPDKRRAAVEKLLDSPAYVIHFANVWRSIMMPEANADDQVRFLLPGFEAWLREKLSEETKYDDLVREILTAPLNNVTGGNPLLAGRQELSPIAFYQAKQIKPENLAAATSRIFLGVRMECAQCHDHPMDHWKQEEFWSYAAFFAGIERRSGGGILGTVRELFDRRELTIPETGETIQASFLDGSQPEWRFSVGPRETLANWMTSAENAYFTRAAANRMWGHFFGIGIVDPVDDFGTEHPPSHPELLDELAQQFAAHDFDVKFLIRAITASNAYQLSSRQTDASQQDPRSFARMNIKGLTPEQLFDSLAMSTGYYQPFEVETPATMRRGGPRAEFLDMFRNESEKPTEPQTTILQALAMMNGGFIANATSLENSETLAAIVNFPLMSNAERIETLYLATLSRKPRPDELSDLVTYVESGGAQPDPQEALSDIFWALINSSEFLFNH